MTTRPGFTPDPPRVTCAAGCGTELLASRASATAWSESSRPWLCSVHDLERRCPQCSAPVVIRNGLTRFAHLSWCPHAPRTAPAPPLTVLAPAPDVAPATSEVLDRRLEQLA